jgi:glycosyltransferase involved in cell wall biosynthesis
MGEGLLRVGVDASPLAGRTGVGNYVATLLGSLCELNPHVEFVLFGNTPIVFTEMSNVTVKAVRSRWRGPLWHTVELGRMLTKNGIQALWGTNGYLPPFKLKGIATVVTIHDLVDVFAPHTQAILVQWGRRVLQPRAVRVATRVIAVSEATAADIESVYGRKVDAVIQPLISKRFRQIAEAEATSVLEKYALPGRFLLTVATLEPRKNLSALITAYINRRMSGKNLPLLVLVGGHGWRAGALEQMVSKAEQSGWVRRLGFVPSADLPALYSRCEVFLMPSIYEGFGMPVVEAQLCGAPVIHGSHASMVEASGGIGVSVDPTEDGLRAAFVALAEGSCALACRLPQLVENDPVLSASRLWRLLADAASEVALS